MKIYKNLVNAIASTLHEIFIKNRYADKALERLFRENPRWGSRDRRFVAEAVYEIVRYYRLYALLAESEKNFWFMTGVYLLKKNIEVPAWPEFRHLDPKRVAELEKKSGRDMRVSESYPDWLWQTGINELGESKWQEEARAMNTQAYVYLRVNTLRSGVKDLQERLLSEGSETITVPGVQNALQLLKRANVFQSRWFREGHFEVQDAGSQLIGEFVRPSIGELIIDACAGAGGKSLQLAALMNNKGKVVSLDVEAWKLEELKKRARRAGVHNIETNQIRSGMPERYKHSADKLLLDVPCSGSGVLKRNPDAKWKLKAEVFERTKELQEKILREYSIAVKPGGRLIYSTCSIFPSENQEQVRKFLEKEPSFSLEEERTLFPSEGFDGFYMARLQKLS